MIKKYGLTSGGGLITGMMGLQSGGTITGILRYFNYGENRKKTHAGKENFYIRMFRSSLLKVSQSRFPINW